MVCSCVGLCLRVLGQCICVVGCGVLCDVLMYYMSCVCVCLNVIV